jgi:hypothetical protein
MEKGFEGRYVGPAAVLLIYVGSSTDFHRVRRANSHSAWHTARLLEKYLSDAQELGYGWPLVQKLVPCGVKTL